MKNVSAFIVLTAALGMLLFLSCKKEYSCEGCIGNNHPPLAVAGPDKVITLPTDSVLLNGGKSSDPDGKISAWQWTKLTGPASFTIVSATAAITTVKNLNVGAYKFELKVTDDEGASARDTVIITVDSTATSNHPPVACAGADRNITLPTDTVTLDGSCSTDPDNNMGSYLWTKIAGPASVTIANANAATTLVSNLTEGVYQFELKVTDADALSDRDTIQVTVIAVSPRPACTNCKIVFVSDRDGNAEIYSCKADGSNISRLTNNAATDDEPVWSPDGSHIAFVSDRTGHREIYIMNADGSNVERRTFSESFVRNPAWSPDGARIAYSSSSINSKANISVVGAMSGLPSVLFETPGRIAAPSWSPDGTKLALVSDSYAYDFVWDIFTINADGTNFTALTDDMFDRFDYVSPRWSPSGTKIAVMIIHWIGTIYQNNMQLGQYSTQIGVMNPNGSGITTIISAGGAILSFNFWVSEGTKISWSPDGTKIAYTSLYETRKDISWVSADGSASGTIVTNGWNADWQH